MDEPNCARRSGEGGVRNVKKSLKGACPKRVPRDEALRIAADIAKLPELQPSSRQRRVAVHLKAQLQLPCQ